MLHSLDVHVSWSGSMMLAIYMGRKSNREVCYKCDKLKYRSYGTRAAIDGINLTIWIWEQPENYLWSRI